MDLHTPSANKEVLVCMHCQHLLRVDGEQCSASLFVPRQVINPFTMQPHHTLWKYRCGGCGKWGFEFDIDDVLPQTDSTN